MCGFMLRFYIERMIFSWLQQKSGVFFNELFLLFYVYYLFYHWKVLAGLGKRIQTKNTSQMGAGVSFRELRCFQAGIIRLYHFNFTSKGEFTYITYDYTLSPTSEIHIGKYTLNTDDADNKQMLLQFEPDVNGEKWEDLTHNYRIRSDNCLVLNETEVFKHFDDYDSFLDEADAFLSK